MKTKALSRPVMLRLNAHATLVRMPLPEIWDEGAIGALCTRLCEATTDGHMYFAEMFEDEAQQIAALKEHAEQAKLAKGALDAAMKRLQRKAPFFAEQVKHLRAVADAQIVRADEAERTGIFFKRDDAPSKRTGGRPEQPTSAAITVLAKHLDGILTDAGIKIQNERARRIVELIAAFFPEYNKLKSAAVIARIS